jgi:hypothetical protein
MMCAKPVDLASDFRTSLSVASTPEFMRVRAAAQIACTYSSELSGTGV